MPAPPPESEPAMVRMLGVRMDISCSVMAVRRPWEQAAGQQGYTLPPGAAQCWRPGRGAVPGHEKRAGKIPALVRDCGWSGERYTSSMLGAPAMGLRARARKATRQMAAAITPMMSAVWMPMPKPILGS